MRVGPDSQEDLIRDAARIVELDDLGHDRFRSAFTERRAGDHLFGGQIVAQALAAAGKTVVGRTCNSLRTYFLSSGLASRPLTYDVERLRDGARSSVRRVIARQDDRNIASIDCSFFVGNGDGALAHQVATMPNVPPPDTFVDMVTVTLTGDSDPLAGDIAVACRFPVLELRLIDHERLRRPDAQARRRLWVRITTAAGIDDPAVQRQLLTYLSDFMLGSVAKLPHPIEYRLPRIAATSLDHAIWFHNSHKCSDWLLYDCVSPYAGDGRALAEGKLFAQDGRLIATVVQETLFRSLIARN